MAPINEVTYFKRAFESKTKISKFYILIKIHKMKGIDDWKTRPFTSTCVSLLAYESKWLDTKLQPLTCHLPTYIKDWQSLKKSVQNLGVLPPGSKLFTADAISMYTNINTDHGLDIMSKWLTKLEKESKLEDGFPINLMLDLLELVMRNNFFQFGDTFWLQLTGTAMGTSVACIYATLYYAWKENIDLLPIYGSNLSYLGRFIDDIQGVWTKGNGPEWESFKQDLDDFKGGQLEWTVSDLSDTVDILDLTLTISTDNRIVTKKFQKDINLYLFVPKHSSHPPGMLKGMVHGALLRLWQQNTYEADYQHFARPYLERLMARGYNFDELSKLFLEVTQKINSKQPKRKEEDTSEKSSFIVNTIPEDWHVKLSAKRLKNTVRPDWIKKTAIRRGIQSPKEPP